MTNSHARVNRVPIDHKLEMELPTGRNQDGTPRMSISCRGMSDSARGPAGPDGKWECPVCGKRVGAITSGYLRMHRARKATQ